MQQQQVSEHAYIHPCTQMCMQYENINIYTHASDQLLFIYVLVSLGVLQKYIHKCIEMHFVPHASIATYLSQFCLFFFSLTPPHFPRFLFQSPLLTFIDMSISPSFFFTKQQQLNINTHFKIIMINAANATEKVESLVSF